MHGTDQCTPPLYCEFDPFSIQYSWPAVVGKNLEKWMLVKQGIIIFCKIVSKGQSWKWKPAKFSTYGAPILNNFLTMGPINSINQSVSG